MDTALDSLDQDKECNRCSNIVSSVYYSDEEGICMDCLIALPTPLPSTFEDNIYFKPSEKELERRDDERLEKHDSKDPDYDPNLDKKTSSGIYFVLLMTNIISIIQLYYSSL